MKFLQTIGLLAFIFASANLFAETQKSPFQTKYTIVQGADKVLDTQDSDLTIESGRTALKPTPAIASGVTLTVDGTLLTTDVISGAGTLAGSGSVARVDEQGVFPNDKTFEGDVTIQGDLNLEGSLKDSIFHTSSDYTITNDDGYSLILVNVGTVERSITLPDPIANIGRPITIKRVDAGTFGQIGINILGSFNGFTNTKIGFRQNNTYNGQNAYITVKSDGTVWQIIGTGNDVVYNSSTTAWSSSPFDAVSIVLHPGKWMVYLFSYRSGGSTSTNMSVSLSTTSGALNGAIGKRSYQFFSSTSAFQTTSLMTIEDVLTTTTFYNVAVSSNVTGLSTSEHSMYAIRIN